MREQLCPLCWRPMTVTTGDEPIVQSHRCRPLVGRRRRTSLLRLLTRR